ncbi:MAG TPA: hypothetical protein VM120_04910 [Bryobacteraceae bacterium]|nr:hypothetical protein [Bryobacteraceae bacterium]
MRYDITLKELMQEGPLRLVERLAGVPVRVWVNVEIPRQMAHMDLNAWLVDGNLFHMELQGDNDSDMGRRMLGYYAAAWMRFGVPPMQVVLYVGAARLTMLNRLKQPGLDFEYKLIDIRDLDAEEFLSSEQVGDNLVAILCTMQDRRECIQRILQRIVKMEAHARDRAFSRLMVLSGLRKLERTIQEEVTRMPLSIDLMENEVLREMFLQWEQRGREKGMLDGEAKGKAEGKAEGEAKGLEQGRREEAVRLFSRMLERRFGPLPLWVTAKVEKAELPIIEGWLLKLMEASSLEDTMSDNPQR